MSSLLLRVCLIGAAIFATVTLSQSHGRVFDEATLTIYRPSAGEVVLPIDPSPGPAAKRRIEWVQAARYMTVVRAAPSLAAPVLFAATYGRPLRVIGRDADFVRVQDLGNGQLGWVETRALAPFFGGYRLRDAVPTAPIVMAEAKPAPDATETMPLVAAAPEAAVKPKRLARAASPAPRTKKIAVNAGWNARIFQNDSPGLHRIAERRRHGGIAGLMQRAFRRL